MDPREQQRPGVAGGAPVDRFHFPRCFLCPRTTGLVWCLAQWSQLPPAYCVAPNAPAGKVTGLLQRVPVKHCFCRGGSRRTVGGIPFRPQRPSMPPSCEPTRSPARLGEPDLLLVCADPTTHLPVCYPQKPTHRLHRNKKQLARPFGSG